MSKYVREGLGEAGKKWYQTLLDVVGEAGASVVEGQAGKAAGDAIRGLHKGWTTAAFNRGGGATMVVPKQSAPPAPAPQRYLPQQPVAPQRMPMPMPQMPMVAPSSGAMMPAAAAVAPRSGMSPLVLLGIAGAGAVVVYLLVRKKPDARR